MAVVDQAIAACGGGLRATIRAQIVANNFLESETHALKRAACAHDSRRFHPPLDASTGARISDGYLRDRGNCLVV
ncbi:hypothetical protein ACVL91_001320 [Bradyrhizobium elkanii]|nr:hypothetical protein [Bradyrhizobium elkanii]